MPDDWMDKAACRDHPVLSPDAWFEINNGAPKASGAQALFVCRNVCPVMQECRRHAEGAVETIAGGGWFDSKSRFREPQDELLDAHQAAAYLGANVDRVRRYMGRKLPVADYRQGRAWFRVEDVISVSKQLSPPHGSPGAKRLHKLKGEPLCQICHDLTVKQNAYAS